MNALRAAFAKLRPEPDAESEMRAFLPDLDAIIEEPPPRSLLRTHALLAGMLVSGLVISIVAEVDIVVAGTGRLVTTAPPLVLQPMERSIVREVKVKAGDHVVKGQLLAMLDPTFAGADMAQLTSRQRSLVAQIQRMEAELTGQPFDAGNGTDPERVIQATLFASRRANVTARLAAYDEDVLRIEASIRTLESERASLQQQVELAREVLAMRETLLQSQTGSKLQALEAQSTKVRTERDLANNISRLGELRHSLASRRAERQSFAEQWRRETMEELVKVRDEAAKVSEDLVKATRMHALVEVIAPADGTVLEVAKRSTGAVIREAEPLVTIIPAQSPLMAEIDLASADVGYAKAGDPVRVKVDAFPYQRHGMLEGRLVDISMESFSPNAGNSSNGGGGGGATPFPAGPAVHRGQVALDSLALGNLPQGTALIPGMTVVAEIKVGTRSVISYFLYPVLRGFGESIREP